MLLVAMPGAPSSVLAPSKRCPLLLVASCYYKAFIWFLIVNSPKATHHMEVELNSPPVRQGKSSTKGPFSSMLVSQCVIVHMSIPRALNTLSFEVRPKKSAAPTSLHAQSMPQNGSI